MDADTIAVDDLLNDFAIRQTRTVFYFCPLMFSRQWRQDECMCEIGKNDPGIILRSHDFSRNGSRLIETWAARARTRHLRETLLMNCVRCCFWRRRQTRGVEAFGKSWRARRERWLWPWGKQVRSGRDLRPVVTRRFRFLYGICGKRNSYLYLF